MFAIFQQGEYFYFWYFKYILLIILYFHLSRILNVGLLLVKIFTNILYMYEKKWQLVLQYSIMMNTNIMIKWICGQKREWRVGVVMSWRNDRSKVVQVHHMCLGPSSGLKHNRRE